MALVVPYLSKAEIESETEALLKSFEKKYGVIQTWATPVDEIIENHLGLAVEFADLGHPAILGQLDIQHNIITINSLLDPSANPRMEGRSRFTAVHEVGHQVLHRPYVEELLNSPSLFDGEKPDIILCRKEESKSPIETQADHFAASLLMPRNKVTELFCEMRGKRGSICITDLTQFARQNRCAMNYLYPRGSTMPTDDDILRQWFREIADQFSVSKEAMVIRLKQIGLLTEHSQREMNLA